MHLSYSLGMFFLVKMYLLLNSREIKRELLWAQTGHIFRRGGFYPHTLNKAGSGWQLPLHVAETSPFLQVMPRPLMRKSSQAALPPSTLHACSEVSWTHRKNAPRSSDQKLTLCFCPTSPRGHSCCSSTAVFWIFSFWLLILLGINNNDTEPPGVTLGRQTPAYTCEKRERTLGYAVSISLSLTERGWRACSLFFKNCFLHQRSVFLFL